MGGGTCRLRLAGLPSRARVPQLTCGGLLLEEGKMRIVCLWVDSAMPWQCGPANVCVAGNWPGQRAHGVAEGVNAALFARPASRPGLPTKSADLEIPLTGRNRWQASRLRRDWAGERLRVTLLPPYHRRSLASAGHRLSYWCHP
jgi:hypothetical protein